MKRVPLHIYDLSISVMHSTPISVAGASLLALQNVRGKLEWPFEAIRVRANVHDLMYSKAIFEDAVLSLDTMIKSRIPEQYGATPEQFKDTVDEIMLGSDIEFTTTGFEMRSDGAYRALIEPCVSVTTRDGTTRKIYIHGGFIHNSYASKESDVEPLSSANAHGVYEIAARACLMLMHALKNRIYVKSESTNKHYKGGKAKRWYHKDSSGVIYISRTLVEGPTTTDTLSGRKMPMHVRAGHEHRFRVGPRDGEVKYVSHYVEATIVNDDGGDEPLKPRLHRYKDSE